MRRRGDVFRPMASTTKIMTCILALENGNPADICTVSETAAAQPKVHLGAGKGTRFYLKDLLYSLMLESHNDTAVMVAEHIGGSVEGFSQMMNQKARDLGCEKNMFSHAERPGSDLHGGRREGVHPRNNGQGAGYGNALLCHELS